MSRDMKYSGNEYFGLVPNSWNVTQLKRLCGRITDGSHFSPKTVSDGEKYITVSNVYDDEIHLNEASEISTADFELLQNTGCQPKQGDVLLAKDGTVGRTAIVNDNNFVVLSSLGILSPGVKYRSLYLKRLLDSDALQAQMKNKMKGSALQRITISVIQNLTGTCPSLEEQDAIISYMEPKCASIDSAISKHQQIIEKLEEYRKAVITQAVTKGLNPNVEMKDSGVPWIGKIPVHWEKMRIKQAGVKTGSGTTPKSALSEYYDGNVSWIQSGDLYGVSSIEETKRSVTETALKQYSVLKVYKHPFVVIAMYGASIGNVAISNIDACVNQACCVIMPNHSNNIAFVKYWLELCKEDFIQQSVGGGQPNISQEKILEQVYVKPPIAEQNDIASYLDSKCSGIANMIDQHNQLISKLQEYKQSLIYNAVTGKIDCTTEANA